jgi:hypothetical protein
MDLGLNTRAETMKLLEETYRTNFTALDLTMLS